MILVSKHVVIGLVALIHKKDTDVQSRMPI